MEIRRRLKKSGSVFLTLRYRLLENSKSDVRKINKELKRDNSDSGM